MSGAVKSVTKAVGGIGGLVGGVAGATGGLVGGLLKSTTSKAALPNIGEVKAPSVTDKEVQAKAQADLIEAERKRRLAGANTVLTGSSGLSGAATTIRSTLGG